MDAVVGEIITKGVTEKELAEREVQYRSNFYSQLESSSWESASTCSHSFRDDPAQINSLLTPFENVAAAQIKAAAAKYLVPTNRTVIDRVWESRYKPVKIALAIITLTPPLTPALAQKLRHRRSRAPAELAEDHGEETSNGLTVVLAPLPNVPKIFFDPDVPLGDNRDRSTNTPGIAQIVAIVANEGPTRAPASSSKKNLRSIGAACRARERCRFNNDVGLVTLGILGEAV